jgi:hypothetical protein
MEISKGKTYLADVLKISILMYEVISNHCDAALANCHGMVAMKPGPGSMVENAPL